MMTNLLQKCIGNGRRKKTPMLKHGSVVRPTMYLASMDIKTAFDWSRPRHVAKTWRATHGWLISAFLRDMSGLEGQATIECVESKFSFSGCLRQGSVEAPGLWQKMATQLLANEEENWVRNRMGVHLDLEGQRAHQICSFMWADNFWIPNLEQMLRTRLKKRRGGTLLPNQQVYGGRVLMNLKRVLTLQLTQGPFEENSRFWDVLCIDKEKRTTLLKKVCNPQTRLGGEM